MSEMNSKDIAFGDLERELAVTRKVLERLPIEHYGWRPHEIDAAGETSHSTSPICRRGRRKPSPPMSSTPPTPRARRKELTSRKELLDRFDQNVVKLRKAVADFDMAGFEKPWTMRQGEQVIVTKASLGGLSDLVDQPHDSSPRASSVSTCDCWTCRCRRSISTLPMTRRGYLNKRRAGG